MVKWDTSTVVAWAAAVASTSKIVFDYITGKKDRTQKTEIAEQQIESTERIDLTKILKDSLDSLRLDVIRLEKKSTDNEMAWIDQAKRGLDLQKELNDAHSEIESLKKTAGYYQESITQYQKENVELKAQVVELTHRVSIFQASNYELQKSLVSLQHQVNQNSESILAEILPVGGPEMILDKIVEKSRDLFNDRITLTGE